MSIGITERGKLQAEETGKYLKQFGQFDFVYSSPANRCIETAKIIMKKIKCNKNLEIKIDKLLFEGYNGLTSGFTSEEFMNFMNKNKKIIVLKNELEKETNPFKKTEIAKQLDIEACKYAKFTPTNEEAIRGFEKFLSKLKKQNHKRILIVTHGIINQIQSIITNTPVFGSIIDIHPKSYKKGEPMPEKNNCSIMMCKKEDNKLTLISPNNSLHLKDLPK
jgi:broad specificity phosphatase PhoE